MCKLKDIDKRFNGGKDKMQTKVKRTELGYAEIAAFAGVNDGGEAVVQGPTVTVNKGMTAPNLKHQSRIFGKRFVVTEEEDMSAKREEGKMISYGKVINGEQTDMDGKTPASYGGEEKYSNTPQQQEQVQSNNVDDLPAWGKVLKNFVDKINDRVTVHSVILVALGIIAALALGFALAK